jgi:hypothetical protein
MSPMPKARLFALGSAVALALVGGPAAAQISGAPAAPPPGSDTAVPEKVAPPQDAIQGPAPGESLSDHLGDTGGVIRPSGNPDPGIAAQPPDPDPGTTRVIPPPGTPGGDPSVQPK